MVSILQLLIEHSYLLKQKCSLVFIFFTEVEKTKCQREQEVALRAGGTFFPREMRVGHFIPQCDEHGNYLPTQCHSNSGYCWCVDRDGNEIDGTRSGPGVQPPCKWLKHLFLVGAAKCTISRMWGLVMPLRYSTDLEQCSTLLFQWWYNLCCNPLVIPACTFPSARASGQQ